MTLLSGDSFKSCFVSLNPHLLILKVCYFLVYAGKEMKFGYNFFDNQLLFFSMDLCASICGPDINADN